MFLKYNLPALIWIIIILVLTLLPGNAFPDPPKFMDMFQPDKIVHFLIFAPLYILLALGFIKQTTFALLSKNYITFALLISISIGGITEKLQGLMHNGRKESIYDFIANTIGCIIGIYVLKFFKKRKIKFFS